MHLFFLILSHQFYTSSTTTNSIRMIWNIWPFFIVFFVVLVCYIIKINHFYNLQKWHDRQKLNLVLSNFYQKFMLGVLRKHQQVCIDCLKPRPNKNKYDCKNCGSTEFYVLDYQNSSYKLLSSL